jgi:PAS domain-containing protein
MWIEPETLDVLASPDEPTFAPRDGDVIAGRRYLAALAGVIAAEVGGAPVLIVARANRAAIAASLAGGVLATDELLDVAALRRVLAATSDDDAIAEALAGCASGAIEHAIAHDTEGDPVGVVAVFAPPVAVRAVLERAAAALAAWLPAPRPASALLAAVREPAVVHDGGLVTLANRAAAAFEGTAPEALIGRPVALVLRAAGAEVHVRERTLRLAGRLRDVLVFAPAEGVRPTGRLRRAAARALGRLYPELRRVALVAASLDDVAAVAVDDELLGELATLAMLDVASLLDPDAASSNRIRISTAARGAEVALEITAAGAITAVPRPGHHLGAHACARRAAAAGGRIELDPARDRWVLRVVLPAVTPPRRPA